jgi:hypothetical protein
VSSFEMVPESGPGIGRSILFNTSAGFSVFVTTHAVIVVAQPDFNVKASER